MYRSTAGVCLPSACGEGEVPPGDLRVAPREHDMKTKPQRRRVTRFASTFILSSCGCAVRDGGEGSGEKHVQPLPSRGCRPRVDRDVQASQGGADDGASAQFPAGSRTRDM